VLTELPQEVPRVARALEVLVAAAVVGDFVGDSMLLKAGKSGDFMKTVQTRVIIATWIAVLGLSGFFSSAPTMAEDDANLAQKLANPVASLVSVPLQYNFDDKYGVTDQGSKHLINIQPVIPFSVSDSFNIISRTILPVVAHSEPSFGSDSGGLGDTLQSLFLSPKQPTASGLIWGVGPALLLPTATDELLGAQKWGLGPTFVALRQTGAWTYGGLANHIWSFAGDESRSDVNATFMQPFMSYITSTKTTITLNSESTYNWSDQNWSVPVNLIVSQLFKIGSQPMQIGVGPRYWIESPDGGPEGWGARAVFTLLFPK
jgi:hypothetical protein